MLPRHGLTAFSGLLFTTVIAHSQRRLRRAGTTHGELPGRRLKRTCYQVFLLSLVRLFLFLPHQAQLHKLGLVCCVRLNELKVKMTDMLVVPFCCELKWRQGSWLDESPGWTSSQSLLDNPTSPARLTARLL